MVSALLCIQKALIFIIDLVFRTKVFIFPHLSMFENLLGSFQEIQSHTIDILIKMCYAILQIGGLELSGANTCGMLIRQIHNALEKIVNNQLKAKDLTLSQMTALVEIQKAPAKKLTFKELEKRLSLAQSTTAGLIFRLEQKNLVSVSGDMDDKRIKYVEITPLGEKFCIEAKQEIDHTEKMLLENLSAAEREILLSLLEEIYRTVRKM